MFDELIFILLNRLSAINMKSDQGETVGTINHVTYVVIFTEKAPNRT